MRVCFLIKRINCLEKCYRWNRRPSYLPGAYKFYTTCMCINIPLSISIFWFQFSQHEAACCYPLLPAVACCTLCYLLLPHVACCYPLLSLCCLLLSRVNCLLLSQVLLPTIACCYPLLPAVTQCCLCCHFVSHCSTHGCLLVAACCYILQLAVQKLAWTEWGMCS